MSARGRLVRDAFEQSAVFDLTSALVLSACRLVEGPQIRKLKNPATSLPLMAKAHEVAKRGHKTGGKFICMGCPPLRSW
jgi:hypothetical protein